MPANDAMAVPQIPIKWICFLSLIFIVHSQTLSHARDLRLLSVSSVAMFDFSLISLSAKKRWLRWLPPISSGQLRGCEPSGPLVLQSARLRSLLKRVPIADRRPRALPARQPHAG